MKPKNYYPIFMDIAHCPCLVVGGGVVAQRKVESLLEADACVTVVSPEVTDAIRRLSKKKKIQLWQVRYQAKYIRGMRIVIGATNERAINERIYRDADAKGIPVNIVDIPDLCRFIVPAHFRNQDLCVAVSTGGAAPVIAKRIKRELMETVGKKYGDLIALLKKTRSRVKELSPEKKKFFWDSVERMPLEKRRSLQYFKRAVAKMLAQAEKKRQMPG